MALRVAVANGNWSNPAIWNGGFLPQPGDVIASNNFTVTIDQNVNVDLLTNTVQTGVSIVPVMTSATTPSGVVTSSGIYDAARADWRAFSGSGIWISPAGSTVPQWIAYEFTTPTVVDSYSFPFGWSIANMPKDFLFQGWDGSTWVTLHSVTGNTTSPYNSPSSIGNTTAYIKYRIYVTAINQTNPAGDQFVSTGQIKFFDPGTFTGSSVAGGGFVVSGTGYVVTCTNTGTGILIGATTLFTYSGTGSVIINGNIGGITANSINGFLISGAGNVTINGTINASTSSSSTTTINVTAAAILNVNGNVNGLSSGAANANAIRMGTSGGILNLVGNVVVQGTVKQTVSMLAGTTLNMTGDILCQLSVANSARGVSASSAIINLTGNLIMTNFGSVNNVDWYCLDATSCTINITGNISADTTVNASVSSYPLIISGTSYLNHIGAITGGKTLPALYSLSVTSINILTGPFISGSTGTQPLFISRMHYRRTLGSYYEFRDNSTNGALPPAGPAPITRLVSPGTPIDAPAASNVRQGVVYAAGSLTGTMVVPAASNVANNVPVDNTLGTAVLDPNAIWAVPLTSINTLNSIGRRVKNAATVETTGAQIQTTLNNNE
jgi:hypothetical protein